MTKKSNSKASVDDPINLDAAQNFIASGIDLENRRIEVRSEITEVLVSYLIRSLMVLAEISDAPIHLYLSSPGGDAYQAFALYDAIRASPCDVHIHASGCVFSAGVIIFLAGDVRTASPNTTFMVHSIVYASGDELRPVRTHKNEVIEGERLNNVFLDMAAMRTKRNRKYWYRILNNTDKYFTVHDAQETGILTPVKVIPVKRGKK